MTEKKKSIFSRAVDAVSSRDEKEALAKAQQEAAAAKAEAARLKAKVAADKAAADRAAAAKAAAERAEAARAAAAAAAAARVLKGKTTGNLKLRSGPGMEYEPPIAYLKPDTELEILEELESWLKVKVEGKEGYVGKKYVNIEKPAGTPPQTPSRGLSS